jgi:glutamate--cysteine ligase
MGVQAFVDLQVPCDVESGRAFLVERALTPGRIGTVGLELERHVVDRAQPTSVVSWRRLQGALQGLTLPRGSRITLEPGGQLELSTRPAPDVCAAVDNLEADDAALRQALDAVGLGLMATGVDPVRGSVRVNPGDRYAAMAAYFASAGYADDAATMMCSSASLQVNVEAGPEHRWAERVAQIHRLSPALVALSASSPMISGRYRGVRSERGAMWQRLDPSRCSPFVGRGDPAGAWASFALAAPVMLLRDPATGRRSPMRERVPLVSWLAGDRTLGDRRPTLFPPLRLRGFLELRMLDAVPARWWPGLAALTVAVLDDAPAADRAAEAVEGIERRTADAARLGVADPALKTAALGVVQAALPAVPDRLRPAVEEWALLLESGRTPADLVLERARRGGAVACLTAPELS